MVATSDVLNALNGGLGRLSRRPLWVGALAFILMTAVGTVGLMSVAIGVLATLRVAYTTSIDRGSSVTSPPGQRLTARQSRPQAMTPISPVGLPSAGSARAPSATDLFDSTSPHSDLSSSEAVQSGAAGGSSVSSRPEEDAARSTLTDLIAAQSPPTPAATDPAGGGGENKPAALPASPAAAETGAVAPSASAREAAPVAGSPPAADIASSSGGETDEIGRLATAPLPIAETAAAMSHLRHALKRRAQARAIKHTVHKPAPRMTLQNNNYRPFDPFQPPTPAVAATSPRPKTW